MNYSVKIIRLYQQNTGIVELMPFLNPPNSTSAPLCQFFNKFSLVFMRWSNLLTYAFHFFMIKLSSLSQKRHSNPSIKGTACYSSIK